MLVVMVCGRYKLTKFYDLLWLAYAYASQRGVRVVSVCVTCVWCVRHEFGWSAGVISPRSCAYYHSPTVNSPGAHVCKQ